MPKMICHLLPQRSDEEQLPVHSQAYVLSSLKLRQGSRSTPVRGGLLRVPLAHAVVSHVSLTGQALCCAGAAEHRAHLLHRQLHGCHQHTGRPERHSAGNYPATQCDPSQAGD